MSASRPRSAAVRTFVYEVLRDGGAAVAGLAAILLVTGPVRTLDVTHTPIAWVATTASGLLVFWAARRAFRPTRGSMGLVAGSAVIIVAIGAALAIGLGPVTAAFGPRGGTALVVAAAVSVMAVVSVTLAIRTTIRSAGMVFLVIAVVALFVLFDIGVVRRGDALRDLRLYLAAGHRFALGLEPYQLSRLPALLADQAAYPFLYPPVTLPLFGALAALPFGVAATIWTIGCLAGGALAFHLLGLRGAWLLALALWPPFFEGLWAGNVAVPALLLLAAGFTAGRLLVLGPLFKVQAAIPALWLLRERRWTELAIGLAMALGICLVTLPLTGLSAWFDWIAGLRAFQESQRAFPVLYAFALPRVVPYAVFLTLAAVAVAWAVWRRGAVGLARLGLASIVASPSLYRHGLLAALPAALALDPQVLWMVLGLPVTYWGVWIAVAMTMLAHVLMRSSTTERRDGHPADRTPASLQRDVVTGGGAGSNAGAMAGAGLIYDA